MNHCIDKIIVDTKDFPDLAEFFSRKAAGDSVSGKFKASLDENAEGVVTLSIDDISITLSKSDVPTPSGEEPVAVKAMRSLKAQDQAEEEAEGESA